MASNRQGSNQRITIECGGINVEQLLTAFERALVDLRRDNPKIINNELRSNIPITEDGGISTDALMMTRETSIDMSKLCDDDRKIIEAMKNGEGTYMEVCRKYNIQCPCSSGLIPRLGEQRQYGYEDDGDTLVEYTDPKDKNKIVWRLNKIASWFRTPECPCQFSNTTWNWKILAPNTACHPTLAREIDEITRDVIRDARSSWVVHIFNSQKGKNKIAEACSNLFLCGKCNQTSLHGSRKEVVSHLTRVHSYKPRTADFKATLFVFYTYLNHNIPRRKMLKHVETALEAFLNIELFPQAETAARVMIRKLYLSKQQVTSSASASNGSSNISATRSASTTDGGSCSNG